MKENDLQEKRIQLIFEQALFAPLLKRNPKYCRNRFLNLTPYISFKDITANRYAIRCTPVGARNIKDLGIRELIVEYENIHDLVNDGWRLEG
jgi:hypothetical protein